MNENAHKQSYNNLTLNGTINNFSQNAVKGVTKVKYLPAKKYRGSPVAKYTSKLVPSTHSLRLSKKPKNSKASKYFKNTQGTNIFNHKCHSHSLNQVLDQPLRKVDTNIEPHSLATVMELINSQNKKIDLLITDNTQMREKVKKVQRDFERNERNYNGTIKKMRLDFGILSNKLENIYKYLKVDLNKNKTTSKNTSNGYKKSSPKYSSKLSFQSQEKHKDYKIHPSTRIIKKRKFSTKKSKFLSDSKLDNPNQKIDRDKIFNLQLSLDSDKSSSKKCTGHRTNKHQERYSRRYISPMCSDNEIESQVPQMKSLVIDGCSPTSYYKNAICELCVDKPYQANSPQINTLHDLMVIKSNLASKLSASNEEESSTRNNENAIAGNHDGRSV
ncbi:unnamed protein product [Moneuplotes crassus]|uniref:Uncharacterized protein n=1 Tax=Euplotes crassus TaxID=5936 RepID=A0AAD1UCG9_EUPCR|nr:unnamed protein product [Moneuplotes crassus]